MRSGGMQVQWILHPILETESNPIAREMMGSATSERPERRRLGPVNPNAAVWIVEVLSEDKTISIRTRGEMQQIVSPYCTTAIERVDPWVS